MREVTELSDQQGEKCGLLTSLLQHKPLLKLRVPPKAFVLEA